MPNSAPTTTRTAIPTTTRTAAPTTRAATRAEFFDRLATVGKAFASAKRLELMDLLAQGEHTVDALVRETGMGVTTVSAHLQILKLAHLVRTRRDGTHIHYRLADDDVAALHSLMSTVARTHSPDVEQALAAHFGAGNTSRGDNGDVEEMGHDELQRRLEAGTVTLIDVRPRTEYDAGHIPGAVSHPFDTLLEAARTWSPDSEIVAYCRGAHCVMAHDAVRLLAANGIHATRMEDGMLEWRVSGRPVEATAAPQDSPTPAAQATRPLEAAS
ncbi:MAG: ArsR/SmtB family transcription factor [Actinomycetota bacterium]